VAVLLGGATNACSSDDSTSAATTTAAEQTSTTTAGADPALVGTWTRTITCDEWFERQAQAGFGDRALGTIAEEWLPDADIADPSHPCTGATPTEHSHFFTEDGEFGSLDADREQVDDGTYEVIDDHTFVMPYVFDDESIDMEFGYTVTGDTISFEPHLPADCTSDHCQEAASWAVSVAYAGLTWQRTG
jgi:hypothetical protein